MSTVIRLQRAGAKKKPYYRLVVADKRAARDGKFIEKVGNFNPMAEKNDASRLSLKNDRIEYWLNTGAEPSEKVAILLNKAGIGKKTTPVSKVLKRRDVSIKATQARLAAEAKKKAEEEAKAKAEEEAKNAEQAA
ncbi:MAG: 30S ribosomal protein S16 [Rickettsiales bacterium]|nr:30S ribosomal protein S16 [Rickettsiales bacterium]